MIPTHLTNVGNMFIWRNGCQINSILGLFYRKRFVEERNDVILNK